MFFLFSSRMGCAESVLVSATIMLLLFYVLVWL
jgi:hypothetical protein